MVTVTALIWARTTSMVTSMVTVTALIYAQMTVTIDVVLDQTWTFNLI